jgi:Glycerophosphoryl diester phosphodiesterase
MATPELVKKCQELGMKFIPWTVNTSEEIQQLVDMGVDGIITDYPDLLKGVSGKNQ